MDHVNTPPQNNDTSWRVLEGWQFDQHVGPHFQTWENHKTMEVFHSKEALCKAWYPRSCGIADVSCPTEKKTGCVGRRILRRWIEPQPSWWPNHENLPTWNLEFGIIIISMTSPNPHHHLQEYAWRKLSVAPWLLIWFREYGYNHQSHTTTGPQPWPRPHKLL